MITETQKKAIAKKTNFQGKGIGGVWLKGVDGYSYSVFVGSFPNKQEVACYYPISGKHYIKDWCPEEVKEVLMELWAVMGRA